jgi:restriction system protein
MVSDEVRIWGIHTLDDNQFLKGNMIAIGWREMDNLGQIEASREAFKDKYAKTYPDATKQSIATNVGMLYRFCHEARIGDYVVFPSKSDRQVNLGVIDGDLTYNPSLRYPNTRRVKWLRRLSRTAFSQGALYEIGSALTFFAVKNNADEFIGAFNNMPRPNGPDTSVGHTADEIIESTRDFILKEMSRQLKGYDLEGFVADLLGAMGYRTTVSPQGGDRGIDITAYKDELPPRILVQVKSQDGDIRETTIQSLKGAMREGDYGLFVTLSNYTKNAQKYLDNTPIIRGINGIELVDLILKYYEDLSEKYRKMIPLKRVYIPVPKED